MKVVLDTNVFVSGIFWSGVCNSVLEAWRDGKFELVCCEDILQEIVETLNNFRKPLSLEEIADWASLIAEMAVLVALTLKLDVVKEDKDDNKFIEAAIEGDADYIVSQDKHLLKLKEFNGIKIINPEEFLEMLES